MTDTAIAPETAEKVLDHWLEAEFEPGPSSPKVAKLEALDDRYRPIRPNYGGSKDAYVDVHLKRGWNELLVKFARAEDGAGFEGHIVVSSADTLHNGLPRLGRTAFPWDV